MNRWIWIALALVLVALLGMAWQRRRAAVAADGRRTRMQAQLDALDTVAAWEPTATRILSSEERQAYATLVRALPEYMVLAQVPLSRFLRVPTRYSYAEWLRRAGTLSADLLVCDRASNVVAVIEVRSPRDSARSQQRQARMERVLKAAGIRMLVWMEGELPTPSSVRDLLVPASPEGQGERSGPGMQRFGATPLSALPVGEVEDSGPGDLREPPPSTWFDDFDTQPQATPAPPSQPRDRA